MPRGTGLDYESVLSFTVHHALHVSSGGTRGELMTVNSMIAFAGDTIILLKWRSGKGLPEDVSTRLKNAIRLEVPKQWPVRDTHSLRRYADFETLEIIARASFSPEYTTRFTYTRVQVPLVLAILLQNNLRVGSISPHSLYRDLESGLMRDDLEIGVKKGSAGESNTVTIFSM